MQAKLEKFVVAFLLCLLSSCKYSVAQLNDYQNLSGSNADYIHRKATPVPQTIPAPSELTATAESLTEVALGWVNNAQYQDGQIIQRCDGASCSDFETVATLTPAQSGWTDSNAVTGVTYSYRIRAYFSQSSSDWSGSATLTMPTVPVDPSSLSATTIDDDGIALAWTDNSSNETGFQVQRCTGIDCVDFSNLTTAAADAESLNNTGLDADTIYCYRLNAYNTWGSSGYTNEAGDQTDAVAGPSCDSSEDLTSAKAAWCLTETATPVVDSVASISLAEYGTPTYNQSVATPSGYTPGAIITTGEGFFISGVQSAMNIGTADFNFFWVAKKDTVAGTDTIFNQDAAANAKGAICYWTNTSFERIFCSFRNSAVDYSTCTWNSATTNAIPNDGSYHTYEVIGDRTAATVNLKIDGTTIGAGCSLAAIAGDSLTNTGFTLGMGDNAGTNPYLGGIAFWRQK